MADLLTREGTISLNRNWKQVRDWLAPSVVAGGSEIDPRLADLSVLSGRQSLWEVAVSAAGYAAEHQEPSEPSLSTVVSSLADATWQMRYPDLEDYLRLVASMEASKLVAAAPVAAHVLRAGNVTTTLMSCVEYCNRKYGSDPAGRLKCLTKCY